MNEQIVIDQSYHIREIEVDPGWKEDLFCDPAYVEYRRKWELASNDHIVYDFPLFLEVEASYSCNFACPPCPRHFFPSVPKYGLLANDLLDKIYAEAKERGLTSMGYSHGGEPLIRKDIPEQMRKARAAGILDRMIHTNASLLTKDMSEELIESGMTKINFSLDAATPEIYAKTRIGGDFDETMENIRHFLEAKKKFGKGYPRVRVSFIVSDDNRHEMQAFYDLWKDKVNIVAFQQEYDFAKREALHGIYKKLGKDTFCCSEPFQLLTITRDGDIILCIHDYAHEVVLGNLKTHTIYECWHSETMNKFRSLHLQNRWNEVSPCSKCVNCMSGNE